MTYSATFTLPWDRPPLTANQRLHWAVKAKLTKHIRVTAARLARDVPFLDRVEVELVWVVTDRRRRDAENPVPTLKALCDGLVDADVVPDDTPGFMVKRMPVIRFEAGGVRRLELTIRELP